MSAFISALINMGCHPNIAKIIWNSYLNSFDRFMVLFSVKYNYDKDFLGYIWSYFSKYSVKKYKKFDVKIASQGYLSLLKWAKSNGCNLNTCVCSIAARRGDLEMLKWSIANGYKWNDWIYRYAAENGHLEIIKWGRNNGYPWDWGVWICHDAALGGHLELLKWLRANKCPWDELTTLTAALNGNLELFKWAVENGCPYYKDLLLTSSLEIMQWIEEYERQK